MGLPLYTKSVVNRNVVKQCMPVNGQILLLLLLLRKLGYGVSSLKMRLRLLVK